MSGALAAFGGNAAMGELHQATGSFAIPMFLLAGLLLLGAVLALCFREPGPDLPKIAFLVKESTCWSSNSPVHASWVCFTESNNCRAGVCA